jgi:hypothetical protein
LPFQQGNHQMPIDRPPHLKDLAMPMVGHRLVIPVDEPNSIALLKRRRRRPGKLQAKFFWVVVKIAAATRSNSPSITRPIPFLNR